MSSTQDPLRDLVNMQVGWLSKVHNDTY